jgi:hypothetical protein
MSTSAPSPPADIQAKIEWAENHIARLDSAILPLRRADVHQVGTKRLPDTGKLVYYVAEVSSVSTDIALITGDAIGNLVSVLDHVAFQLYRKNTSGGDGRNVQFPISRKATTAAEYVSRTQGQVQGIDPAVATSLHQLEAYQGGKGHQLWVLNELNNLSKHRQLFAVAALFHSMDLGADLQALMEKSLGQPLGLEIGPIFVKPADPLCPLQVGDELFIGGPEDEPNPKMKFTFDVSLHEPQIVKAEPLIETVRQFADLVKGIVDQFAAHL